MFPRPGVAKWGLANKPLVNLFFLIFRPGWTTINIIRLINSINDRLINGIINRLVHGRIDVLVSQLAAHWPQVALPRRLPIGWWPYWFIFWCCLDHHWVWGGRSKECQWFSIYPNTPNKTQTEFLLIGDLHGGKILGISSFPSKSRLLQFGSYTFNKLQPGCHIATHMAM